MRLTRNALVLCALLAVVFVGGYLAAPPGPAPDGHVHSHGCLALLFELERPIGSKSTVPEFIYKGQEHEIVLVYYCTVNGDVTAMKEMYSGNPGMKLQKSRR